MRIKSEETLHASLRRMIIMADYILEARGIVKTFPGVRALDGVNLRVKKGEVHALVGENGAGKSTLMLTLGGIHKPDAGEIFIEGRRVTLDTPHDANRKGISIVFQELSLVPNLSIAENIFANRQPVNSVNLINWKKLFADTLDILKLFGLECLDPAMLVKYLSLANQQVVEILKAMSMNPKVLILDEPTSSLTEMEVEQLFRNIGILKEKGIAFIYISHHLPEIFRIADTVTVLRDGQYVCDADVKSIDEDFLVTNMVGRKIVNMYGARSKQDVVGDVIFEARSITRKPAFRDISFSVRSGEIVGFAGLVGAGRTEVGRAIFGAEPIESGELLLYGKNIHPDSPKKAIRVGIGYMSEDRKTQGLYLEQSIRANLISNHLGDFCTGPAFISDRKADAFAEQSMKDFKIVAPGIGQVVKNLSGGNQQKVLVGTWFGIRPKLLIVDEPTKGVDVGAKSEIYVLLRGLARQGVGILLISSDLSEVLGVSDRIIVMQAGKIVGEVTGADATEEKVIALATGATRGGCGQ